MVKDYLMTVNEAALQVGKSPESIYRAIRLRKLPVIKNRHGHYLLRRSVVDAWVQKTAARIHKHGI